MTKIDKMKKLNKSHKTYMSNKTHMSNMSHMSNKTNKTHMTHKTYMTNKSHKTNMSYKTYLSYFVLAVLFLTIIPLTPKTASAATLTRPPNNLGLVGYWSMNEGRGTQVGDSSGKGNTGTITGASWVNGKRGKALSFNGSSDLVGIDNPDNFNYGVFTASAWIKTSVSGTFKTFVGRKMTAQGWNLLIASDNKLKIRMDTTTGTNRYPSATGPTINDGQWHYVAVVVDLPSTQINLYVDGENAGSSSSIGGTFSETGGTLNIMGSALGTYYTNGIIDDVRIYNRALTASEVSALYKSGQVIRKVVSNQGLVGYWSMNEGRGAQVGDSSGKGNTGTITGASWTDGKRGKALSFSGSSQCVDVGSNTILHIADNYTISAWVKTTTIAGVQVIYGRNGNIFYLESNKLKYQRGGTWDTVVSNSLINPDQWYHVAFTKAGTTSGTFKLFIDGIEDKTGAIPDISDTLNSYIGCQTGNQRYFNGIIDDVRIYNRALSASEILALYGTGQVVHNAGQNDRLTNGLVGLWSFNGYDIDNSSTTAEVLDRSGNGNNGDNVGAIATQGKVGQAYYCTTDDQVTLPNITEAGSTGTYAFWIKPDSIGVNQGWIDSNYDIFQWGGNLYFRAGNQSSVSMSSWNTDDWRHVTMTWDGSNYFGYVDGSQVTTGIQTDSRTGNIYMCRVDLGYFYSGSIDEVRVYNRALSASEVKQLYDMGK